VWIPFSNLHLLYVLCKLEAKFKYFIRVSIAGKINTEIFKKGIKRGEKAESDQTKTP